MDKLFKVGGVSKANNHVKVRFANDMTRVKILAKTGSTDIELLELPEAMTKSAIVTYLKTTELYAKPEYKEAIDVADINYNGSVKTKATKVKTQPSMEALKARAEAATEATE
jgi:type IV secretory pathway component VirB8